MRTINVDEYCRTGQLADDCRNMEMLLSQVRYKIEFKTVAVVLVEKNKVLSANRKLQELGI